MIFHMILVAAVYLGLPTLRSLATAFRFGKLAMLTAAVRA